MNIKDLEYLIAIAKYRHFGKAAASIPISQPTLSMQLKKLEQDLGVELIQRNTKLLGLTDAGQAILEKAHLVIDAIHEIETIAKEKTDPLAATLRIGIFPTLAPYFLALFVTPLRKKFPKLRLVFIEEKSADLLRKLEDNLIDAAFLSSENLPAQLTEMELFSEPFYVAAHADHQLAKKKTRIRQQELNGQEMILLEEGHCLRDQVLSICKAAKGRENLEISTTSLETIKQIISSSGGMTLMPALAIDSRYTNICYRGFADPKPTRQISLVFKRNFRNLGLLEEIAAVVVVAVRKKLANTN